MPDSVHDKLLHRLHRHVKLCLGPLPVLVGEDLLPRLDSAHLCRDEVEEVVDYANLVARRDWRSARELLEKPRERRRRSAFLLRTKGKGTNDRRYFAIGSADRVLICSRNLLKSKTASTSTSLSFPFSFSISFPLESFD